MKPHEWNTDVYGHRGRMATVLLLALLLSCVFFLAMGAYGYFSAVGEGSLTGELPDAVLALRNWVEENEAVSVFLGLSDEETAEVMGSLSEREAAIRAAADAYIREKQGK